MRKKWTWGGSTCLNQVLSQGCGEPRNIQERRFGSLHSQLPSVSHTHTAAGTLLQNIPTLCPHSMSLPDNLEWGPGRDSGQGEPGRPQVCFIPNLMTPTDARLSCGFRPCWKWRHTKRVLSYPSWLLTSLSKNASESWLASHPITSARHFETRSSGLKGAWVGYSDIGIP